MTDKETQALAGVASELNAELGGIMSNKPNVGQQVFATQFGYAKPRYFNGTVSSVGRKYFEVDFVEHYSIKFEIAEKRGCCWYYGDITLWESKAAYTDFRHAENIKSALTKSLDNADLQRLVSLAKFMDVFVEYPMIDT